MIASTVVVVSSGQKAWFPSSLGEPGTAVRCVGSERGAVTPGVEHRHSRWQREKMPDREGIDSGVREPKVHVSA